MKTRLVYFGNERLISGLEHTNAPILRGLIDQHDVIAVVSHDSRTKSRKTRRLEVAEIAKEHDIPVFLPQKPLDIYDELSALDADAAVLVAYGKIIPQKVIDIFPSGIINVHPSLLPLYRGPTPIETPLLNGDDQTGTSIMQLSAKMDEGPVYAQTTVGIAADTSKSELYEKLAAKSASLLLEKLPSIIDGSLQPTPQDHDGATYCRKLEKSDALIDPNKISAEQATNHIRACLVFPGTKLKLGSVDVIITKAHLSDSESELSIKCSDGKYLVIDSLKPLGKKEMPVKAFLAGYKDRI